MSEIPTPVPNGLMATATKLQEIEALLRESGCFNYLIVINNADNNEWTWINRGSDLWSIGACATVQRELMRRQELSEDKDA